MKDLSIVIPLFNEKESLPELYSWIVKVLTDNNLSYQIIFIDDGSKDGSWEQIKAIKDKDSNVIGIKFIRNYGKSQALNAGFIRANGNVVITMDADLQDSPNEIPDLYKMITHQGFDLVSGWKQKRYDNKLTKNIPSKLFNWAARKVSGLSLHDFNCGLKAYRLDVVKNIDVSGEMHRYIPLLAKNAGFSNITEKVVIHSPRKYGVTKFGLERFINGFLDLLTISFLSRFSKRPMHFFGALGVIMFFIGFCFAFYMGVDKLFINTTSRLIASRPEFYISLVTMILGTQLFLTGFLAELIIRSKNQEKKYIIETEI